MYGPTVFLEHMLERFPFKVECVQTDSGSAFTKRLGHTQKPTPILFGARPEQYGIRLPPLNWKFPADSIQAFVKRGELL